MNVPQPFEMDSVLNRMSYALSFRIEQKCADLTVLFDRASKQDLQTIFPIIVDNIFGPQGTSSWNLRKIHAEKNYLEFSNIMNFLKPHGPMFRLIYTLLLDVTIKYEFSLAYLPVKIRQMLDGPNINPFYNEIIQYTNHQSGRQIMSLLLNPFDYYIFHFAYHLINPCQQRVHSEEHWNTAFYNLSAEYLLHFFPTIPDTPILPLINFYHGKNPMQTAQHIIKPYKQASLLKQNLFGDPQVNDMKVMHQHIEKHPRNEIWRSETLLVAITDLWLSNDQVCSQLDSLPIGMQYPELPSDDYIRIVRVTVKHLHAFASTANIDNTSLGELKKHTLPMMQTRMYMFLRNLLHRWPLDESFRLVLELWLSFIQPWRYSYESYNRRGGIHKSSATQITNTASIEEGSITDDSYMQFITENLLSYIVILQQLLPRFARIDLASPKNAQMLFRLTKVFNQPNLVNLLKRVERLIDKNYSPTHQHQHTLNHSSILPPLSPTSRWSTNSMSEIYSSTHMHEHHHHQSNSIGYSGGDGISSKYLNVLRQKIYELEGPKFCYKPMFTSNAAMEVYELLKLTKAAEIRAIALWEQSKERSKTESNFWSMLFGEAHDVDEVSLHDRQKAPMFLRHSLDNLLELFQIKDFYNFDITPEQVHDISSSGSAHDDRSYPMILTPSKVKERLKNMKYEGDPDLIPIRSYEVAFLVRLFYALASKINEAYGPLISNVYYNRKFLGRFAANFLQDPMQAFKFEKDTGLSRRVMVHLPPRISLRRFTTKRFVLLMFIAMGLSVWYNYGWILFPLIYIFLHLLLAFWRAIFTTRSVPTLDLNFNDSLDE